MQAPKVLALGKLSPLNRAKLVLLIPAIRPLMAATSIASLVDTLRVRLLSIAQHRQAATISNALMEKLAAPGAQDSNKPPPMIVSMPSMICRSAFSLKTNQAMTAVRGLLVFSAISDGTKS